MEKFSVTVGASKACKYRCRTKAFKNTKKALKRLAHRSVRAAAKRFIFAGGDDSFSPRPGLTSWDII